MPKTFYHITKNEKYKIKNKRIRKKIIEEMRNEKREMRNQKLKNKNKIFLKITV